MFATVDLASVPCTSRLSKPSFRSSPWICGAPQSGFSKLILRIRSRTCPYRKSDPHVLMVQSTKHRPHFDAPGALDVPPNGRILA